MIFIITQLTFFKLVISIVFGKLIWRWAKIEHKGNLAVKGVEMLLCYHLIILVTKANKKRKLFSENVKYFLTLVNALANSSVTAIYVPFMPIKKISKLEPRRSKVFTTYKHAC